MSAEPKTMRNFERDSLAAVWRHKRIWLVQALWNAVLLVFVWLWTMIPDAHTWEVAGSILLCAAIAFFFLWLQCGSLGFFQEAHQSAHRSDGTAVWPSLRRALPRVPAFLVWTAIVAFLFWQLGRAADIAPAFGGWLRGRLPFFLRRNVSPRQVWDFVSLLIAFLALIFVPMFLLPVAAQVSRRGFGGFGARRLGRAFAAVGHVRYWIAYVALFVAGVYLPAKLAWWKVPARGTISTEAASVGVRLIVAYLLIVTCWVILVSVLGRLSVLGGPQPQLADTSAPSIAPAGGNEPAEAS